MNDFINTKFPLRKIDSRKNNRGNLNQNGYYSLPYNPALKARARELRKSKNLSEVLLWNQFKNKQWNGFDFDRQKIIGNYIVDFFCRNCRVVIEVDGSSHNTKIEYDAVRDAYFQGLNLEVIHIRAYDVLYQLDNVLKMLKNHPALQIE